MLPDINRATQKFYIFLFVYDGMHHYPYICDFSRGGFEYSLTHARIKLLSRP